MRLMAWREKAGISRKQIVVMLGMDEKPASTQSIRHIERGETDVPIVMVPKIIGISGGAVSLIDLAETRQEYLDAKCAIEGTSDVTGAPV